MSQVALGTPRLRGVLHEVAFFVSPLGSAALWARAHSSGARVAVVVYAVAMTGLFGVSALFHRRPWSPPARVRMGRLDHSMIFVAIAGTYTAIAGLALRGVTVAMVLTIVWAGALGGIGVRLFRRRPAPKWMVVLPYVGLGWIVALAILPQLLARLGVGGVALILVGGACYTTGAVVYAGQRPDPNPAVFGYHEVFHAFVLAGAVTHYAVVAFFVLPRV